MNGCLVCRKTYMINGKQENTRIIEPTKEIEEGRNKEGRKGERWKGARKEPYL